MSIGTTAMRGSTGPPAGRRSDALGMPSIDLDQTRRTRHGATHPTCHTNARSGPPWPPRSAPADELGYVQIDPRGFELLFGVKAPADLSTWLLLASARAFASHEMKDATELAERVSSAGFEFDCGRGRYLL